MKKPIDIWGISTVYEGKNGPAWLKTVETIGVYVILLLILNVCSVRYRLTNEKDNVH